MNACPNEWIFSQFFPFFSFAHEDEDEIVRKVRIGSSSIGNKRKKGERK